MSRFVGRAKAALGSSSCGSAEEEQGVEVATNGHGFRQEGG